MSARIKDAKDKIVIWLKEEFLSPEEIPDPNAYFNVKIKEGDLWLNVVQNSRKIDSLFVGTKWILSRDQLESHKTKMDESKRIAFYWNLQSMLLVNNRLGDFEIGPNPPHDFRELFVSSNPVFYDSLTKQSLMHSIYAVHRSIIASVFLFKKYCGEFPPLVDMK